MSIMSNKPKILLVEDDDFAATVAIEVLVADYDVRHVSTGKDALGAFLIETPDLVLLDVALPEISGYEVCSTMRKNPDSGDLPIMFLSGLVSEQERLAGYEAGGDDYLTKPVLADELRSKIQIQLSAYAERRRLKADLSNAFSTAMAAMSTAAEIGTVVHFLRTSFSCLNYPELCSEILKAFAAYGLEASVKIHGEQGSVSYSPNGLCSPLEDSVLTHMSRQGRLFEFGTRTSCSYGHITIIVKSDPRDDPERHGRMKDNLALLAEGADARVIALDSAAALAKQHEVLSRLTGDIQESLQEIDCRHRSQASKSNQISIDLQKKFDRCVLTLGITHSQEEELAEMLQEAANCARALYDEGLEIGTHMGCILKRLNQVGH